MVSIVAEGVDIEFPIYGQRSRSLRNLLLPKLRGRATRTNLREVGGAIAAEVSGKIVVKALQGLSFSLGDGDRLGVVGHNGAGKTTLLRVLAGIYEPVRGSMAIAGSVTPLFSLVDGMDPDATGYENIWLRSRVLGFSREFITAHAPEIVDFCELGDFLDMPLRTYSSGMALRLGFAIATALDPQILIMDEMIGAGDASFLARAEARLGRMITRANIMVVATHSTAIVRRWCNKAMLLRHGRLELIGDPDEVLRRYEELSQSAA